MQNNAKAQNVQKEQEQKEQKQEQEQKEQDKKDILQEYLQDKLQNINAQMQQEQKTKYQWYIKISNNNKYLYFTKATKELLQQYGLHINDITPYNYIKYSDAPNSYNNILNIFKTCTDIFKQKATE